MKRFRAVPIDQAEEGMQLFQDLDDGHGQRLLPAGSVEYGNCARLLWWVHDLPGVSSGLPMETR